MFKRTMLSLFVILGAFRAEAASKDMDADYDLGVSYGKVTYQETGVSDYSATVVIPKFSYTDPLFSVFEMGGEIWGTATTLKTNTTGSVSVLGARGRLGLALPIGFWRLGLYGGYNYRTMLVSGDRFGFKDMNGPEGTVSLKRMIRKVAIEGYGRYAKVSSGDVAAGDNREIGAGMGIIFPARKGTFGIRAEVSEVQLSFVRSVQVKSRVASAGLSFGF